MIIIRVIYDVPAGHISAFYSFFFFFCVYFHVPKNRRREEAIPTTDDRLSMPNWFSRPMSTLQVAYTWSLEPCRRAGEWEGQAEDLRRRGRSGPGFGRC